MNIEPLFCLSNEHISQATCEALQNDDWPIAVYPNEYGAFVCVPEPKLEALEQINENLYPDLLQVLKWAQANSLAWIKFDGAGNTVEGLPTYEW